MQETTVKNGELFTTYHRQTREILAMIDTECIYYLFNQLELF